MRSQLTGRTLRRLLAADGYLEFNLPGRAITELQKTGEAGPLEGPRQLLWGVALNQNSQPEAAIKHLEKAARLLPPSARCCAWKELESAYLQVGSHDLAELASKLAGNTEFDQRPVLQQTSTGVEFSAALQR
jgi:predicted Zn-dependent protease